jgi:hypothetical protein
LQRWLTIGLVVIGLIVVAFIAAAAIFPGFRVAARDISIIIMMVVQTISAVIGIIILLAIWYAIRALRQVSTTTIVPKLDDILENTRTLTSSAQDTVNTARTTTTFVAERVASPLIRMSGAVAGVVAAARALARRDAPPAEGQHRR